jgi:hypothetical protein
MIQKQWGIYLIFKKNVITDAIMNFTGDYKALQCSSAQCIPCNIRFPTCTGLPDGLNPWVGREWTPDYVTCEEERVILQGQCKSEKEPQVFHPNEKTCVVYDVKKIIG